MSRILKSVFTRPGRCFSSSQLNIPSSLSTFDTSGNEQLRKNHENMLIKISGIKEGDYEELDVSQLLEAIIKAEINS